MGDILTFPSSTQRGLAYLDRTIRDLLTSKGADDELIDFAALRERFNADRGKARVIALLEPG